MSITKNITLFIILFCCSIGIRVKAEQEAVEIENNLSTKEIGMRFSVSIQQLRQNTTADEALWIEIANKKHLILKHSTKGRKQRGNVLLLHAQGENADHLRLIQPIAKQLAILGWNIFIPSIALEDFAKPLSLTNKSELNELNQTNASTETVPADASKQTEEIPVEHRNQFAFKDSNDYQQYFVKLCKATIEQMTLSKLPTIVIANQNSAYWAIQCLNSTQQLTHIIFLQPQLPQGITNNLGDIFALQTLPVFSFQSTFRDKDIFATTFKKRLWRSRYQRFNIGMLSSSKIHKENNNIARTITGWIERQTKK